MKKPAIHFIEAEADIPGLCHRGSLLRFRRTGDWLPGMWQLIEVAGIVRVVLVADDGGSFTTAYGESVARSDLHRPMGELVEVRFYPRRIKQG